MGDTSCDGLDAESVWLEVMVVVRRQHMLGALLVATSILVSGCTDAPDAVTSTSTTGETDIVRVSSTVASSESSQPLESGVALPGADAESIRVAEGGVSANAVWSPVTRDFDGVEMVLVPAGRFRMGSTEAEIDEAYEVCRSASWVCETSYGRQWYASEAPRHEIVVDEPFWIDRYEVTNGQFDGLGGVAAEPSHWVDDDRPRETVNWFEAADFCESREARLPTEAEWEYAARGPDGLTYPWGRGFVEGNVVYEATASAGTAPVGSRPGGVSWVGALDMSGNVEEWVNSFYFAYPYDSEDGREAAFRINASRSKRGGSWTNWGTGIGNTSFLRAAYRSGQDAQWGNYALGFRCVRSMSPEPAESRDETTYWPVAAPGDERMDADLLQHLVDTVTAENRAIDSVTVVRNGRLVLDEYFAGFESGRLHSLASCTKSIMSVLIGIAIDQGHIDGVDHPVLDFFPDREVGNRDGSKEAMTLENLLTMSSGMECADSEDFLTEMRASGDWIQFVLDRRMSYPPGDRFEYCSSNSFLLSAILQQATGMNALAFARENLFEPLGITEVYWPASPDGITHGWGDLALKPHDMAKIGVMLLDQGQWEGRQIVSSGWVEESTVLRLPTMRSDGLFEGYGYQWWVDPAGLYAASGTGGQFIYVVPGESLVVVFTGRVSDASFDVPEGLLREFILPAAS